MWRRSSINIALHRVNLTLNSFMRFRWLYNKALSRTRRRWICYFNLFHAWIANLSKYVNGLFNFFSSRQKTIEIVSKNHVTLTRIRCNVTLTFSFKRNKAEVNHETLEKSTLIPKNDEKKASQKEKNSFEDFFLFFRFSKFKSEKRMLIVDSFYADPRDFLVVVVTLFFSYAFHS